MECGLKAYIEAHLFSEQSDYKGNKKWAQQTYLPLRSQPLGHSLGTNKQRQSSLLF